MKTAVVNTSQIQRRWYLVDAADMALGRVSSKVAGLLMGKGKVAYSPNQDHGDNIVVINSSRVRLSGTKAATKEYFRHTTFPGGGKTRSFREQMELDSTQVIRHAVKGMLPKGPLGRSLFKKLYVYGEESHPHAAQKPQPLAV